AGRIRSVESAALMALRLVDIEAGKGGAGAVNLRLCTAVALYVLNHKRSYLIRLEQQRGLFVTVIVDDSLAQSEHVIERTETNEDFEPPFQDKALPSSVDDIDDFAVEDDEDDDDYEDDDAEDAGDSAQGGGERPEGHARADENDANGEGRSRRRRRRRRGGRGGEDDESGAPPARADEAFEPAGNDDEGGRRRRRGRRGGRRSREESDRDAYTWVRGRTPSIQDPYVWFNPLDLMEGGRPERTEPADRPDRSEQNGEPAEPRRSRSRGRGRGEAARNRAASEGMTPEEAKPFVEPDAVPAPVADAVADSVEAPKRRRVRRKPAADVAAEAPELVTADPVVTDEAPVEPVQAAPEPEPAQAQPEPEQPVQVDAPAPIEPEPEAKADVAAIIEADPAQISTPPAKPKRGWWRR
ncbi:MAG: ribonuclease E/G, partial [Brevundimonas sp.]